MNTATTHQTKDQLFTCGASITLMNRTQPPVMIERVAGAVTRWFVRWSR